MYKIFSINYIVFSSQKFFPNIKFSKNFLQGLSQNWSSFSLDRLVTPSIGIPTKCMYSVVHYLSNKHLRMSVCQINLELQLVLWKQLRILLQKKGGKKLTNTNLFTHTMCTCNTHHTHTHTHTHTQNTVPMISTFFSIFFKNIHYT